MEPTVFGDDLLSLLHAEYRVAFDVDPTSISGDTAEEILETASSSWQLTTWQRSAMSYSYSTAARALGINTECLSVRAGTHATPSSTTHRTGEHLVILHDLREQALLDSIAQSLAHSLPHEVMGDFKYPSRITGRHGRHARFAMAFPTVMATYLASRRLGIESLPGQVAGNFLAHRFKATIERSMLSFERRASGLTQYKGHGYPDPFSWLITMNLVAGHELGHWASDRVKLHDEATKSFHLSQRLFLNVISRPGAAALGDIVSNRRDDLDKWIDEARSDLMGEVVADLAATEALLDVGLLSQDTGSIQRLCSSLAVVCIAQESKHVAASAMRNYATGKNALPETEFGRSAMRVGLRYGSCIVYLLNRRFGIPSDDTRLLQLAYQNLLFALTFFQEAWLSLNLGLRGELSLAILPPLRDFGFGDEAEDRKPQNLRIEPYTVGEMGENYLEIIDTVWEDYSRPWRGIERGSQLLDRLGLDEQKEALRFEDQFVSFSEYFHSA